MAECIDPQKVIYSLPIYFEYVFNVVLSLSQISP